MYRLPGSFLFTIFAFALLFTPAMLGVSIEPEARDLAAPSIFSFYEHCCQATWFNGGLQQQEIQLPCPGSEDDDRGFVRPLGAGYTLETDQPAERTIETHPRWVVDGYIYGVYKLQSLGLTLQAGDRFVSEVGFLKGAAAGQVRFSLWYDSNPAQPGGETLLAERQDQYDGKLRQIEVDLSGYAGASGALQLRVDALGSSGQDWAVWVDPHIEREPTPTLKPTSTEPPPTFTPTHTLTPIPALTETPTPTWTLTATPAPVDNTPPIFISGPAADQQTQDSARICWTTDEPTTGRLLYDSRAGKLGLSLEDQGLTQEHCLSLTNLQPITTYQFVVQAQDQAGNNTTSRQLYFTTASPPDDEDPMLELRAPETLSGIARLEIPAVDNIGIDRVVFFLDGQPVLTDYTYPYFWPLDTRELSDGDHSLGARAIDIGGNQAEAIRQARVSNHFRPNLSPVHVYILNPASRSEVYGWVEIQAEVTHDHGSPISRIEFRLDETVLCERGYHSLGFIFNPETGRIEEIHDGATPLRESCPWDFAAVDLGSYIIQVEAWDQFGNSRRAGIMVEVAVPTAEELVRLERQVIRHGNWFEVQLRVVNTGGVTLENVNLVDTSKGFQAVRDPDLVIGYDRDQQEVSVGDELGTLSYGANRTMSYSLVPVLFDPPLDPFAYNIGRSPVEISFQDSVGQTYSEEIFARCSTDACSNLRYEVRQAARSSDYLIVTNPHHLFDPPHDGAAVNELLSTMAELAKEKLGVLGYLKRGETNDELRGIISPCIIRRDIPESGLWHMWMPENWWLNGYLLIVGEEEIVPAYFMSFLGRVEADGSRASITVNLSDNQYADLCGEDGKPELRVGRIIGDTVADLITPLRTSLDVGTAREWDRSDAFLVSGPEGVGDLTFIAYITEVARILQDQGIRVADPLHTEYYDTEISVLREALTILCTFWDLDDSTDDKGEPPDEISDLEDLIGDSDCSQISSLTLSQLQAKLSLADAARVWAAARGIEGTYTTLPTGCDALARRGQEVKNGISEKDLVLWVGHGLNDGWSSCLDSNVGGCGVSDLWIDNPAHPINFGSTAPVVIAASCFTGHYEPLSTGASDYGIAEAFLRNGAAVYIGCTRSLSGGSAYEFMKQFVRDYWTPVRTVGEALVWQKNALIDADDTNPYSGNFEEWLRVSHIYNIFGDPKLGRPTAMSGAPGGGMTLAGITPIVPAHTSLSSRGVEGEEPPEVLEVHVPDYTLTSLAGFDYMDIPGGNVVLLHGQPRLPSYTVSVDYPEGYWIQDVTLREMGGMLTVSGLNLPLVDMRDICSAPSSCAQLEASSPPLNAEYSWRLSENPDGSTRLAVTVFPLIYDPATQQAEYYRDYTFDIRYAQSTVRLSGLSPYATILRPGETVSAHAWLDNPGQPQDVVLSIVIRRSETDEIVIGLPIRTLNQLVGAAAYTVEWDSTGAEPGLYLVEATVSDDDGTILDRRTAPFALNPSAPEMPPMQAPEPAPKVAWFEELGWTPLVLICCLVAALGTLAVGLSVFALWRRARKPS